MAIRDTEIYDHERNELVGYMPNWLQKWGMLSIAIFLCGLLVFSTIMPYPEMIKGRIEIYQTKGTLYVAAHNTGAIQPGMQVRAYIENYPEAEFGYLSGQVKGIGNKGKPVSNGTYAIEVQFDCLTTQYGRSLSSRLYLEGTGEITLRERRLIELLVAPIYKIIHH